MDSRCYERHFKVKAFRPLFVVKERIGGEGLKAEHGKGREEGSIDW